MARKHGFITIYNTYSIPTTNINSISTEDDKIYLNLKRSCLDVDDKKITQLSICFAKKSQIKNLFKVLLSTLCEGSILELSLDQPRAPSFKHLNAYDHFKCGLLIINETDALMLTDINCIFFSENCLVIYLKHPVQTNAGMTGRYVLEFADTSKRDNFHDRLIETMYKGGMLYHDD